MPFVSQPEKTGDAGRGVGFTSPIVDRIRAAGNVLELRTVTPQGATQALLVMSSRARAAFDARQMQRLHASVDRVVDVALPTIETLGGGGVRCMLAEVPDCCT